MKNLNKLYLMLFLSSGFSSLQAAEWRIEPTLRFQSGYNNNITLTPSADKPASAEISFQPALKFSRNTATSSVSGTLQANIRRFSEEEGLNDENFNFNVDTFKSFQQHDFRLGVGFIKDTTLETELEETGLFFGRTGNVRQSLSPSWSWRFNERTSARLSYDYNQVDYDENPQGYVDSTSHTGQLSLSRVIDERTSLSLSFSQTLTDNENDVLSRFSNLQTGFEYNLNETLRMSFSAGARRTTTKFSRQFFLANVIPFSQQVKAEDNGSIFSTSLTKTTERSTHALVINRNISNSVSGRLIEVTRAGTNHSYHFSNRLSGSLNFDLYESLSTNDTSSIENIKREYYTISPGVNWKLSKYWTLSGNYQFKKQTNNNSGVNAIQNSLAIYLNYHWPRIAISR